jgi:hypothetical protein
LYSDRRFVVDAAKAPTIHLPKNALARTTANMPAATTTAPNAMFNQTPVTAYITN